MTAPTQTQQQHRPTLSTDLYGSPQGWRTWPDWVNLIIALVLATVPLWTPGAPIPWFFAFSLLIAATAIWGIADDTSKRPEWATMAAGALLFLAPWFAGFHTASDAAWTAWILAGMVVAFSATALTHRKIFVDDVQGEHVLVA